MDDARGPRSGVEKEGMQEMLDRDHQEQDELTQMAV